MRPWPHCRQETSSHKGCRLAGEEPGWIGQPLRATTERCARKGEAGIAWSRTGATPPEEHRSVNSSHDIVVSAHPPLASLLEEWEELGERLNASPFIRAGWIAAWSSAWGSKTLRLLVARSAGDLVGVMPLLVRGRSLALPSNAHSPQCGAMAADDVVTTRLIEAALGSGARSLRCDQADSCSPEARLMADVARAEKWHTSSLVHTRSPFLDTTGTLDEFERGMGTRRRKQLRRRRRRLSERGELTFELHDGANGFDGLLDEGLEIEASGWKGRYGTAIACDARTLLFYRGIATWAAEHGWLRLAFLRLDGRALAFRFTLEQGNSLFVLKSGYREEAAEFSPGVLLAQDLVRHAFEERLTSIEWLGADDAHKHEWSTGFRERLSVAAFAGTVAGPVRVGLTSARSAIRERAEVEARKLLSERTRTRVRRSVGKLSRS